MAPVFIWLTDKDPSQAAVAMLTLTVTAMRMIEATTGLKALVFRLTLCIGLKEHSRAFKYCDLRYMIVYV